MKMSDLKKIRTALISVYYKDNLEPVIRKLHALGIELYSTGGTFDFITKLGIPVKTVESLTGYPPILGGRVKTLHPKVFGGILARRNEPEDLGQLSSYDIPQIDLVIVDLYPFEETVAAKAKDDEIIEKIDIGGISLIRAAAKNYNDVLIVSSREQYPSLQEILHAKNGETSLEERKHFAASAFDISSHYDASIYHYFQSGFAPAFKQSIRHSMQLRYGENPHQKGIFYGDFYSLFDKLNGKEISYNNILDIDAAVSLIGEFEECTFAIIKHNNACGIASRPDLLKAWNDALAGDPLSAYGGILVTNTKIDLTAATEIHKLFSEVIIAPGYEPDALALLKEKKNRVILVQKSTNLPEVQFRSVLNGALYQERDNKCEKEADMKTVTKKAPSAQQIPDLEFACKVVKHSKSNTIVLVRNKQLLASGVGQTSRVDALKQAIEKAKAFGFDLKDAVMASDAFFPFADSVEVAFNAGITAVIQPGGSVRDQDSIDFCDKHKMAMVFTGVRHFKH
jgi:phosphoribosylaminoimidazolecarboxamide formyltransferase / IMP cyclohydrolase